MRFYTLSSMDCFVIYAVQYFSLIEFFEFVNRTLVLPYDLGRFDAMVSAHEKEALEYLSGFVPGMYFFFVFEL